ncbi:hypothetical protein CABS01_09351 [Colletotrichum abscissum]|uniref:uncharacterized protein n=1 Tax=Colletotrichum abscissum TaxID=1671311 RepID=UPI0027D6BC62|nr:uncharacterized protein CABS01_09351 [Colletotrichum abscissum]KAK1502740.1 hypothetical protein CABS01_09351 [Colletotrichum abscissum]
MPTLYRVEPLIALSLLLLVLPHSKLGSQSDHSALRLSARQTEWSGPRIGSPSIHDPFQHASAVVTVLLARGEKGTRFGANETITQGGISSPPADSPGAWTSSAAPPPPTPPPPSSWHQQRLVFSPTGLEE